MSAGALFDHLTVVGGPLVLSTPQEVSDAEARVGTRFPTGYAELVTRFGEGILGDFYIRIYPPYRIVAELGQWRQRITEYWFWDDGHDVLTRERALQSVVIGDTIDGDELIVHPDDPERIYVLPRNYETIFIAGDGLPAAIEWICNSGVLTEAFTQREFEPFDGRLPRE